MNEFKETLHRDYGQSFAVSKVLLDEKTSHQHLVIFDNPVYGRVMALDGVIQTTEKDEFIYHEMFTHVPLLEHGAVKRVLIVGGGDGGILREVARYPQVESITMVEIDEAVVELSKKYFPKHSNGSFNDSRLKLVIDDGLNFIKSCNEKFDVILSDSTDPIGPGEALFREQFYQHCRRCLTDDGIVVTQNGVSFLQVDELCTTQQRMQPHMEKMTFYHAAVPTYIGGNMCYAWGQARGQASASLTVLNARHQQAKLEGQLKYYNTTLHRAAFALPQYVQDALHQTTLEENLP